jgi:hypothetical protein
MTPEPDQTLSRSLDDIVANSRPIDPRDIEERPGFVMHLSRGLIYPRKIWSFSQFYDTVDVGS